MSTPKAGVPAEPPLRTITLLALAAFAGTLNIRISDPLLAQVAAGFSTTVGKAAIIITAFTVGYGLFQLAFGPVGDRFGKYRVAGILSLGAGIATTFAAFAETLGDLTLARFVAGAISSAVIPLAFAWLGDAIPFERRQAVLARFLTAQFSGIVVSQAAGGYIGAEFGWRTVFVLVGAVHLIAGVALLAELKLNPAAQPVGAPGANSFRAMLDGLRKILARPFVRVMLVAVFLEAFAMYGAFAYVGADLVHRLGASFALAGVVLAVFGAGALSYSFSARWLLSRFGERGLVMLGGAIIAAGFGLLAVAPSVALAIPAMSPARPRLLHVPQHAADQRHPDGARGARARGVGVRVLPVHRPVDRRGAGRPDRRPLRRPAHLPCRRHPVAADGAVVPTPSGHARDGLSPAYPTRQADRWGCRASHETPFYGMKQETRATAPTLNRCPGDHE